MGILIGLTGAARSGKDTVAEYIGWPTVTFAAPLKKALSSLGWERSYLYGDDKEKIHPIFGVTGRHAMQTLGTEWGRKHIREDIWIRLACATILQKMRDDENIIVTDVRFDNEAMLIHMLGGMVVKTVRDTSAYNVQHHASEEGIRDDLVSAYLDNNASLSDLGAKVFGLLQSPLPEYNLDHILNGEFFLANNFSVEQCLAQETFNGAFPTILVTKSPT